MAKSYTQGRNLFGVWTKNTDTTNLAYGDQVANDDYRHLCALKDWPFLERNRSISTAAGVQFTTLPYDCDMVREISVVPVGNTTRYTPRQVADRAQWDMLNLTSFTSDIPEYWFAFAGQLGLWPSPISTGNTIYVTQKTKVIDLSAADYTAGTITTTANATVAGVTTTTVTGNGTAWTAPMVGRYIRITYSDTTNTGDGQWYEIASVASATSLTLVRVYGGTAITGGTANYTIGQMPLLPEAFHDLPWQYAAGTYWAKEADERSVAFLGAHGDAGQGGRAPTGRVKELINAWSSPTTDMVIDHGEQDEIVNPNLVIRL